MGYESKFYVVEKSSLSPDYNGFTYSSIFAVFDMCELGYKSNTLKLVKESPKTNCFFYADDGNTRVIEDMYGEELTEINIDKLISALKKDNDGYRRIQPFISFLESIDRSKWHELKILHFGH